jgi:hypothetical protein
MGAKGDDIARMHTRGPKYRDAKLDAGPVTFARDSALVSSLLVFRVIRLLLLVISRSVSTKKPLRLRFAKYSQDRILPIPDLVKPSYLLATLVVHAVKPPNLLPRLGKPLVRLIKLGMHCSSRFRISPTISFRKTASAMLMAEVMHCCQSCVGSSITSSGTTLEDLEEFLGVSI